MKATIRPTAELVQAGRTRCLVWEGETGDGKPVVLHVAWCSVPVTLDDQDDQAAAELPKAVPAEPEKPKRKNGG